MLTGDLVRVKISKQRVVPLYIHRDEVLRAVAEELKLEPDALLNSLFADLRDENRLLNFEDITAQRLIDRYNVAMAQAVMLRSVLVRAEVRNERPARYRQLFRRLKFRQVAPAWELSESTDVIELGREGVWVPDYRLVHKATGTDVFLEVVGFWKRSSLERLLRLLPSTAPLASSWPSPTASRSTRRLS